MTERFQGQKLLIVSFFTAIGLFLIYFVIFISRAQVDSVYTSSLPAYRPQETVTASLADTVVLQKGRQVAYEDLLLTYRGYSGPDLVLDVVVLALDPGYAYQHRLSRQRTDEGQVVRIAGKRFELLSIGRGALLLKPFQDTYR